MEIMFLMQNGDELSFLESVLIGAVIGAVVGSIVGIIVGGFFS